MAEMIETVTGHPGVVGGEFIVLRGELGGTVLWDVGYPGESPEYDAFVSEFEIDSEGYLGDPEDSFYQVITFTRLVRRRSDGALFGAAYYSSPGNDFMEGGNEGMNPYKALGVPWDWESGEPEPLVLLPVRRFERVGYEVDKPVAES